MSTKAFHSVSCVLYAQANVVEKKRKVISPICCCITVAWICHTLTRSTSKSRCAAFCCKFLGSCFLKKPAKMNPEGKKLLNIIILGVSFMFLFTAFQTCGNIEVSLLQRVPDRVHIPSDKAHKCFFYIFSANGYQELQQHRVPWEWIHEVKASSVKHTYFFCIIYSEHSLSLSQIDFKSNKIVVEYLNLS